MAEDKKPKVTQESIVKMLEHKGFKFRLNTLTDRIDVNGIPITDGTWAQIRNTARDRGIGNMKQVEDAVLEEALKHEYHPIKEYLQGQMGWDGTPFIANLASYFTDVDGTFPWLLEKFLIGAVHKAFDSSAQNPMLVLDGPQNLGKSEFASWLCPPKLHKNHFIEAAIHPENKDDMIALANVWIWEVMELGSTTRKADREALKGFISTKQVTVRKPYGKEPMIKPALASFIGTINNEIGFLSDPTGHRRFRPVKLARINWGYKLDFYQGDIWAEAYAKYLADDTYKLTKTELDMLDPVRSRYELTDPMEELILKHFDVDPSKDQWWMSSLDILYYLGITLDILRNWSDHGTMIKLGVAASKLGLEGNRVRVPGGQLQRGYKGIKIKKVIP